MDWLLNIPQMHSAFSSLGSKDGDSYIVNPDALAILEEINCKLIYEDQTLRTYRRAIGFGQNVRVDLIPLLINSKDPKIFDAAVRILVNLTVPIECLFSVDLMYRTEAGRHTIFDINKLLVTSKKAFTDAKSTKSVIDYVKFILENDNKLSPTHCDTINNCLLLLRNILHIPEPNEAFMLTQAFANGAAPTSMQNTILWNLFIQSIDKVLLYLMSCPRRKIWGVAMIQLIAVMYKDQHINTLQKLLNNWFEASISESSCDNESNTTPPNQGSGESSPMLTSDPTSDSSDNGGGRKNDSAEDRRHALSIETEATLQEVSRIGQEYQNAINKESDTLNEQSQKQTEQPAISTLCTSKNHNSSDITDSSAHLYQSDHKKFSKHSREFKHPSAATNANKISHSAKIELHVGKSSPQKRACPSSQSEQSDCGYVTQVEHQESISTSSNDDDSPEKKPMHQKPPCNQKQRIKPRIILSHQDCKDLRRKKLVKRGKCSLVNMKGFVQHIPNDEDISNLLKEFTVDFLLKGYGPLVQSLHAQLLTDTEMHTDTSHFFWLLTYFLKFSAQLELDLEHIRPILNFDIISYLTYEGISLCEQLELTSRQRGSDFKPIVRRMHLVITAIREFLISLENYKKISHLSEEDLADLHLLEIQLSCTEDLRLLFVILIRKYNETLQTKQYLQDLIVTNHKLLLIIDAISRKEKTMSNVNMTEHISQFGTIDIMHKYAQLLETFDDNGDFVNDCIFTMMHHVSGDLGKMMALYQPLIFKVFSRIYQTDYQMCDDWKDLIEFVIHRFVKKIPEDPITHPRFSLTDMTKEYNSKNKICSWAQVEMDTLYWYFVQSKKSKDVIGKIESLFAKNGSWLKSRISIIQQLLQQDIITLVEYDDLMKFEDAEYQRSYSKTPTSVDSGIGIRDGPSDDIQILKALILKEGKSDILIWLQRVLLECCYIKLSLKSKINGNCTDCHTEETQIMEPIAYQYILRNKSVPIVPWSTEQANAMMYQPFIVLLHKVGFQLPADAGSAFARVPEHWSPELMFSIVKKLGPLDKNAIKFNCSLLEESSDGMDETDDDDDQQSCDKSSVEMFALPKAKHCNSIIRFVPDPASPITVPNWLQLVMRSKPTTSTDSFETESVASDLTQMYVSDEDDKLYT